MLGLKAISFWVGTCDTRGQGPPAQWLSLPFYTPEVAWPLSPLAPSGGFPSGASSRPRNLPAQPLGTFGVDVVLASSSELGGQAGRPPPRQNGERQAAQKFPALPVLSAPGWILMSLLNLAHSSQLKTPAALKGRRATFRLLCDAAPFFNSPTTGSESPGPGCNMPLTSN